MKPVILVFSQVFLFASSVAQKPDIIRDFDYKSSTYDILILSSGINIHSKVGFFDNTEKIRDTDIFANDTLVFAITASIVDSSCNPLGLYISTGKMLNNINLDSGGKGNFFALENGILSYTADGRFIIERSKAFKYNSSIEFAIQTGPILVWNATVNGSFGINSRNFNFRCGVGIFYKEGKEYVIFAKSNSRVTFYDFSSLFSEAFHCNRALTLESGDNSTMHLPGKRDNTGIENIVCRYIKINFVDLKN